VDDFSSFLISFNLPVAWLFLSLNLSFFFSFASASLIYFLLFLGHRGWGTKHIGGLACDGLPSFQELDTISFHDVTSYEYLFSGDGGTIQAWHAWLLWIRSEHRYQSGTGATTARGLFFRSQPVW